MKPLRLMVLALAGSALLLAQSGPRTVTEIPFAFEVANQVMPMGEYDFAGGHWAALTIRDVAEGNAIAVLGYAGKEGTGDAQVARLVFHKYGDRYFLAEVAFPEMTRTIAKSRSEKELVTSKLIAAMKERVVILARVF
jgi:hypothetical protein